MKKQNVRTLSFIVATFTYLLIGATIFDALESNQENEKLKELNKEEFKLKQEFNISDNEFIQLQDILIEYHSYKGLPQWKFIGSFYFSLTVITTIGYGHSTPQTIQGKLFCMLYGMIGIPLCLVMFQSVGERLNFFTLISIKFFKKCFKFKNIDVTQTELVIIGIMLTLLVITTGASIFSYYEDWSYFEAIYYCFVTLTTIGFGDFVALSDYENPLGLGYVILSFSFFLFGLAVVASSMNLLVLRFLTMNTDDERKELEQDSTLNKQRSLKTNVDLINIVNGNAICTFEQTNLDDLKRENKFYCPSRNKLFKLFFNKFYPKTNHHSTNLNSNYCFCDKRKHYTIRRGPGKLRISFSF